MPFVYILKSMQFSKTYTGSTDRTFKIRLNEHNQGNSPYTAKYRPWKLFFVETDHQTLSQARRSEKILKSGFGKEFLKSLPKNMITYRSGVAQRYLPAGRQGATSKTISQYVLRLCDS